jgi:hypothetical protein
MVARKGFALLFKTLLIVMALVVLTPIIYFAWRAGQPMDLPQYKGLTYYQFLTWRSMAYDDLARNYQAAHPDQKVKFGMCEWVDSSGTIVVIWPQSGLYTLAGIYPSMQREMSLQDRSFVPQDAAWFNFLPSWWKTGEMFIWSTITHAPVRSVAYCRIQPDIPTPAELEARMLDH